MSELIQFGFKDFSYEKYLREEPHLKVLTPEKAAEYMQSEKGQILAQVEAKADAAGEEASSSLGGRRHDRLCLRKLESVAHDPNKKGREIIIKQFFEFANHANADMDDLLTDKKLELTKTEKEAVKALRKDILRDMSRVGTVASIGKEEVVRLG